MEISLVVQALNDSNVTLTANCRTAGRSGACEAGSPGLGSQTLVKRSNSDDISSIRVT